MERTFPPNLPRTQNALCVNMAMNGIKCGANYLQCPKRKLVGAGFNDGDKSVN